MTLEKPKTLAFNAPLMQFAAYGCMLFISWFGAKAYRCVNYDNR